MSRHKRALGSLVVTLLALALLAPTAGAAPGPAWQLSFRPQQTNLQPGQEFEGTLPKFTLLANNVGGAPTTGATTLSVQLPAGISPSVSPAPIGADQSGPFPCSISFQTVTCVDPHAIVPGQWVELIVYVGVDQLADPTVLDASAAISGGGASSAGAQISTTVSDADAPFGFLPGFEGLNAALVGEDGSPASQAGSHPQQLNINLALPTKSNGGGSLVPDGTLHDTKVDLPAGLIVDPGATPRCTAAQFAVNSCPDSTQIGIAGVPLLTDAPDARNLYSVEPPPGYTVALGFTVNEVPVFILGGLRPGDYRITSLTPAALSLLAIFSARIQLWGSPSDESHDAVRGSCLDNPGLCPVTRTDRPLLTLPTSCSDSMQLDAHLDLWEELGNFYDRIAQLSDSNANPTGVTGCNALQFEPSLQARPTTNLADSPTGLEVDLQVPQDNNVNTNATAHLRKVVVTLPEGLVLNPSSANGLQGCDPEQVGIDPQSGVPDGDPVTCPDASRIGTVQVETPLLDHGLPGSVFVATPHKNPFDSLLAIYVVFDDPQTGTLVKLAGHVVADPQTGRLTTTFDNNPQLPFSSFELDFFGGAYAPLRTPATCGTYSTTSRLTPWSAPDSGPPATPKDTYAISQSPAGGPCAASPAAQPNSPSFDAGSASPIAGAYKPFVVHLRRNDATQNFAAVTLRPPPGLTAKLAGTPYCPEAALAAAAAKSGGQEKAAPSCPAASQIGTVTVGAGAGPAPYYTRGKAYLTGPYKGAPLSLAIITPATAGPYDLGTVVTRTALQLDRETAEITATSDPIPQILEGIPLDIRSIDIAMDKPDFTLNGTSCNPLAVTGELFSSLGQRVALSNRFQLAECGRLPFGPKLKLALKGATKRASNPRLIADLTAKPGEANIARAQVKLPTAAFLDNTHIGTICTRVLFAADNCPPESVYGKASATSPLLDYPVQGAVYLRSSSHVLPDLVVKLRGPDNQPIEVDLAGKTDAVKGALRNTFEAVPDVPVSTFHLELFGGKRGLIELSRNLCAHASRATVALDAQNGEAFDTEPVLGTSCKKRGHKHSHRAQRNAAR